MRTFLLGGLDVDFEKIDLINNELRQLAALDVCRTSV